MEATRPDPRVAAALTWLPRVSAGAVALIAVVAWVGWATGKLPLTQVVSTWPHTPPWTALLMFLLAVAILVQSGHPSPGRVYLGQAGASIVGVLAAVFLAEYLIGTSIGLDTMFFSTTLRESATWMPGHPGARTALSILLVSIAIAVTRLDRSWTRWVWPCCLAGAAALPIIAASAYLFDSPSMVVTLSIGMSLPALIGLLLLVNATLLTRPDRNPVAWLLARPDRWTLAQFAAILTGLPIMMGLLRRALLAGGVREETALVLSITMGTILVGGVAFYFGQREQRLLIEKEHMSSQRAVAEQERAESQLLYRLLADNSVDVVLRLRGSEVVWISPSVQAPFGDPPEKWIGTDILGRLHPDDVDLVVTSLQAVAQGEAVSARARLAIAGGGYHWVEGHGKPYINDQGDTDGVIAAFRVINEQVEAEKRLERLAKFDAVTGLVNRAEAGARLESSLENQRSPGGYLGVLFCDIDHFKDINDTWGHAVGDVVLSILATRIRDCVRQEDTVGRTGGDEMLVLLPGMHDIDEAAQIAKKIRSRAAEPIHHSGTTLHATLSIGVTLAHPGEAASAVTARADAAMYDAKQAGRNTTVTRNCPPENR
ncbi:MAG: diguanylate cyclase [Mycolicibacterium sp.]|uniref:diguanylate cyclase domain-containing protein n=1 Tax=Mycolicibacterium sp. TaxID=2320850 RepID=UPI003D0B0221